MSANSSAAQLRSCTTTPVAASSLASLSRATGFVCGILIEDMCVAATRLISTKQVIPSSDPITPSDSKQPKKVVAYEYSVGNTSYLTEGGPISEISAYHINSRATRVWLVREIIPNSTPLAVKDEYRVLKDVWFDSGAKLEMDISNDIFGRLKESDKKNGTTDESEARDYFMKFEHDEFVEMDGTTDVSFELPKGYRKFQGSGIAPSPSHEFQHHTRAHVRTVYAEVCRSIYELRDYATVVRALRDNVK
ncbi:hypothetical protein H0H87_012013, partial [Tephrocybe sp. NHM501043]